MRVAKQNHQFCPPRKAFGKIYLWPPGKNPSDAHAHKHAKLHIRKKLCCIIPSGNTVQQHHCGKQAIAGWHTVHSSTQLLILSNSLTYNVLQRILTKYCRNKSGEGLGPRGPPVPPPIVWKHFISLIQKMFEVGPKI